MIKYEHHVLEISHVATSDEEIEIEMTASQANELAAHLLAAVEAGGETVRLQFHGFGKGRPTLNISSF
jgi:hypothetical protein